MNKTRIPTYKSKLSDFNQELARTKKKHGRISMLRLSIFIGVLFSWFYVFTTLSTVVGAVLGIVLIVVFLILLKVHKRLEDKRRYLEAIIEINTNEIACCNGKFSVFNDGSEYVDHNHQYSYDIDLFGKGSLFQYLNRTVTIKGKNLLSSWLSSTPLEIGNIRENQRSVKELAEKLDFRQEFQVVGDLYASETEEEKLVDEWIEAPAFFKKLNGMSVLLWLLPIVNLSILVLTIIGYLNIVSILYVLLVNLTLVGYKLKQFNAYYGLLNRSHNVLRKVSRLVEEIELLQCKTNHLCDLKNKLAKNGLQASEQIQQLTRLINGLDNRNNMLLGVILNGFLLWDWQYVLRIDKWRLNHKFDFGNWLESIANFDALISLANLAYNNTDFTFPKLSEQEFEFKAKEIGHPLLSNEIRVCNDFEIMPSPRYAIVTGANMAGKSTFLRTIATNIVLAGCGGPVCAKELVFKPLPLHSSMRAEDSLLQGESYFFAELKRLQKITRALEKGEKLFIILDEILRGTNSEDKRKGSIGFVQKITEMQAHGLVATHDLELARLTEQKPDIFKALCFEVEIKNNELEFDYKLQPGVTQNMNASFLMKQMGII